jgi:hypothetical protein
MPTSSMMMNKMLGRGGPPGVGWLPVAAAGIAVSAVEDCAPKTVGEIRRRRIARMPHACFMSFSRWTAGCWGSIDSERERLYRSPVELSIIGGVTRKLLIQMRSYFNDKICVAQNCKVAGANPKSRGQTDSVSKKSPTHCGAGTFTKASYSEA